VEVEDIVMRKLIEYCMQTARRLNFPLSIFVLLMEPFYYSYMIIFDKRVPCYVYVPYEGHFEYLEVWPE
jgi:hypothetical protein